MTANLTQRLAASALIASAEMAIATGKLSVNLERELEQAIRATRSAFGPDIPERDLPSNVVRIGDHDPEYIRALNAVSQEMGS